VGRRPGQVQDAEPTGITFAPSSAERIFKTECPKMALSVSGYPVLEPNQAVYRPAGAGEKAAPRTNRAKAIDAFTRKMESHVDNLKRRIAVMERMIADFECMAADLDREILSEQERTRIHDPAHFAYPTYAKAAGLRRDNLKRSADELKAQLEKANDAATV
jgi:hypothetical protein